MTDTPTPEVSAEDFTSVRDLVADFVRTKVIPREQEILDADAIPDDIRATAKDMGLFGYAIPQEWGGLGLDLTQDVELAMELGYTSLALRSMFGTNNGIAVQVLVGFGTDEQKARWLPPLIAVMAGTFAAYLALKGLKKKERKQLEKILGKIEGNLIVREDTGEDEQSERD